MSELEEPVRWCEGAEDAPESFAVLLRAEQTASPEPARLLRVLDNVASQLSQPELSRVFRQQQSIEPSTITPQQPASGLGIGGVGGKLVLGLVVVGIGAATLYGIWPQPSAQRLAPRPALATTHGAPPVPDAVRSTAIAPTSQAAPSTQSAEAMPPQPPARAASRAAPRSRAPKEVDATGELALLERAQRALRDTPSVTLALTEQHRARFGRGQFEQEREMLAIEALLRLGQIADAKQRGRRFAQRHPGSSHLPHLEDLLRSTP